MGQVFRARDTRLNRDVALKVLPDSFASDADRLARFTREAQTLAALNHPHIAAIYGLEESNGVRALVMEFVEGEDLAQRMARRGASGVPAGLPLDEALPIARQIAEALEAAHEQGIIHRDLKPANIKVRGDGVVKVLDFGLAKALDAPASSATAEAMNSPTITSPAMTQAGVILGTAAYMSPEQARGKKVDKRADIWAFGAVLFEMLTGTRAFPGEDLTDTLAAVVRAEPNWSLLPAGVPSSVVVYLKRCLHKDPKQRIPDIAAMRLALDGAFDVAAQPASAATTASPRGRRPVRAALVAMAAITTAMAVPTLRHLRETPPVAPPEMRVEITTPATDAPLQFDLSPDGRSIVFVASGDGVLRLWLRRLDETDARPLAGTEGVVSAFWSPDSRTIGFFAGGRLLRVDVADGVPQVLATASGSSAALGGTWTADGTILFTRQLNSPIWRVPADGGEPVAVTRLDPPRQSGHRYPHFLPDGRHFVFYVEGTPETGGLYLASLDGGAPTRLTAADNGGAFLPPDRVVFVRQGTLVARRLDLAGRALTGAPVTLADGIGVDGLALGISVSRTGQVAYRAIANFSRQFTWFDRTGKRLGVTSEPDANGPGWPELSGDDRRVAMRRAVQGNIDIWLQDLVNGRLTRLTFDAASDGVPIWSPDGERVAFASNRTGVLNLYVKSANGAGVEEVVVDSPNAKQTQDWSRDGRWLLYYEQDPKTGRDLWALDMTRRNDPPRAVANTPAQEVLAQLSPDGRWMAYQTNESGRFEVVVQPFPDAVGSKWQVSTAGGVAPRWRADGKELYFLAPDAKLMAVSVTATGASFESGTPVALFPTRVIDGGTVATSRPQYDVARDGRFLINQPVADAAAAPITLILNWTPPIEK